MMIKALSGFTMLLPVMLAFTLYAEKALTQESAVLPNEVSAVIRGQGAPLSGISIYVQEVGATEPLLSIDANKARNPASAIKLLTTWVALEQLGPAWTWTTEAYAVGDIKDGVLDGDLYLKGYGDPYFITERLWWFQRQLKLRGINDITGGLVIDNTYFDVEPEDSSKFDGEGLRAYNVAPDALLVNFQAMYMTFRPDLENNRVELIVDPLPTNLTFDNRLKLKKGGCGGYQNGIAVDPTDKKIRDRLEIRGKFGRDCAQYSMTRAALTAPTFAYGVFRSIWEESGGTLQGGLRVAEVPPEAKMIFSAESPPLSDVITYINKFSNNVMARQLFLTLAAERDSIPGTLNKARKVTELTLRRNGLEFDELEIANGSGLSRDSRISAEHLGQVLEAAAVSPWSAEFISSMSLPGLDGTLRKRFTHEAATGRMHMKTGRLKDVYATAGYVHADSGREYVLVVLQNYRRADKGPGEAVQAALLRWVHQQ